MKNWWLNLSLREKQTFSAGTVLVSIFLIYEIIFSPLLNEVNFLRQKIHTDQTLLAFMQASDDRIRALQKNPLGITRKNAGSLFSIVQDDINTNPIAKAISQLQQAENDSVQLRLQKVNFDEFIKWLTRVCQEHQLIISQLSITPGTDTGEVDADLKLQLG
jgi:general secretion pathway protein M